MCGTCGCDPNLTVEHGHDHGDHPKQTLDLHASIFAKNDHIAAHNRDHFQAKQLLVMNLLSSPGAGKTALLERMQQDWRDRAIATPDSALRMGVIVGDLATENDAQRLQQVGLPAIQITTGTVCHLDAAMIRHAVTHLDLDALNVLIIENVGNLVCPAAYDLGEGLRVALLSVTEGEDKPLKYPVLFKSADVVLITKIDLAEATGFDWARAIASIEKVAPHATRFEISTRTGQGMAAWYEYLMNQLPSPLAIVSPTHAHPDQDHTFATQIN